ncbi:MAG: ferredoxin [Ruminococcaceae bacterium]|nr:ferredoxin [Oscillospiraceae bacterium]
MNTVWAVYFTGTGNTKSVTCRVADAAAQALGCPRADFDFSLPASREQALRFSPGDLVILGTPVYAGRVPNKLLPFLTGHIAGNGALCVPVVTFGNRNFDDGLMELVQLTQANELSPIAAGAFVGEHSFSTTLGAGRPDSRDLALADTLGRAAAEKALSGQIALSAPVDGNDPIGPYYTPRDRAGNPINILKVKPKTDPAKCVNCGLCARICTMGSIDPADPSSIPGTCIKCCACVKGCPTGAKYYDDEGYLYHKRELEAMYARPAESKIFL